VMEEREGIPPPRGGGGAGGGWGGGGGGGGGWGMTWDGHKILKNHR